MRRALDHLRVLFLMAALAGLLVGCSESGPKPPAGLHLLADGSLRVESLPKNQAKVSLDVNLTNAGTETCQSLWFDVRWPSALNDRVLEGEWTGVVEPFAPGAGGQYTSTWTVKLEGLSPDQASSLLAETRIAVICKDPKGYENLVTPQRH